MHINKKDLIEFDNGNMNTQEVIEFLSHLDHCDFWDEKEFKICRILYGADFLPDVSPYCSSDRFLI